MHGLVRSNGAAATAIAFAGFVPGALAAERTTGWNCQDVGQSQPLGDREGHAIPVSSTSCRAISGPLAGGVMTTQDVWEWDGPNAVLISFAGVVRKNGATLVWKSIQGKLELTKTEGKVTGWTVSGELTPCWRLVVGHPGPARRWPGRESPTARPRNLRLKPRSNKGSCRPRRRLD